MKKQKIYLCQDKIKRISKSKVWVVKKQSKLKREWFFLSSWPIITCMSMACLSMACPMQPPYCLVGHSLFKNDFFGHNLLRYATIYKGDTPTIIPMQKDNIFRQKCPFQIFFLQNGVVTWGVCKMWMKCKQTFRFFLGVE